MSYHSLWETAETEMFLRLNGENYEINHGVMYKSKHFKKAVEEASKEENLENF